VADRSPFVPRSDDYYARISGYENTPPPPAAVSKAQVCQKNMYCLLEIVRCVLFQKSPTGVPKEPYITHVRRNRAREGSQYTCAL